MQESYVPEELLTVRHHAERFSYLSEPALRDLIFHSTPRIRRGVLIPANGLADAFPKLGRSRFVDPFLLRKLIASAKASTKALTGERTRS